MSFPQAQNVPEAGIQLTAANGDPATGINNPPPEFTAIDVLADSPKPNTPLLHLLEHKNREEYLTTCVTLYKYALRGDWESAEPMISRDRTLLRSAISRGWDTVLHVAAGARHIRFVRELVDIMDEEDLELQDIKGNTALCLAAAAGSLEIAEILIEKQRSLLAIRGGANMAPPYMAVVLGQSEMAWYLYTHHKSNKMLERADREALFFSCINNGLYDLALELLDTDGSLCKARTDAPKDKTALHILARRPPSDFDPRLWSRLVNSFFPGLKFACKRSLRQAADDALQLVQCLWDKILREEHDYVMNLIKYPSNLLFDAAESGNYEFLATLISSYPDLIWETDANNRTIIHVAVLNRHANIFNLVNEIGSIKDIILTYVDHEGNNIVHMAAKLAPPNQLNLVSGVALQMQRELVWFEEVKRIVQPEYREMENNEEKTPQQIFTEEHEELMSRGEKWMKGTAKSCLLVSTIIATVVFAAAFSIPGGSDDHTGRPHFIKEKMFLFFALADQLALVSSSTAMLMFLFILTSRYAEKDFLVSLPLKLMVGLTCLFISIASMMMDFSTAFYLSCQDGSRWIPQLTFIFALIPITLYAYLQFPLVADMSSSTFCSSILFQPWKHMIY